MPILARKHKQPKHVRIPNVPGHSAFLSLGWCPTCLVWASALCATLNPPCLPEPCLHPELEPYPCALTASDLPLNPEAWTTCSVCASQGSVRQRTKVTPPHQQKVLALSLSLLCLHGAQAIPVRSSGPLSLSLSFTRAVVGSCFCLFFFLSLSLSLSVRGGALSLSLCLSLTGLH